MGLDCTAYSHLTLANPQCRKDDGYDEWDCYKLDHVRVWMNSSFPHAAPDLAGLEDACLATTDKSEEFGWHGGSYGGYNMFRDTLAEFAFNTDPGRHEGVYSEARRQFWRTIEQFSDKPFYEMINFSDCEGAIGPSVSAKLHDDFVQYRDAFFAANDDDYDRARYDEWLKAYDIARHDGFVSFH